MLADIPGDLVATAEEWAMHRERDMLAKKHEYETVRHLEGSAAKG